MTLWCSDDMPYHCNKLHRVKEVCTLMFHRMLLVSFEIFQPFVIVSHVCGGCGATQHAALGARARGMYRGT